MTMSKYTQRNRFLKQIESIAASREDWETMDGRLSDGQLHYLVTGVLKTEPLIYAAKLLALAGNSKSKVRMPLADQARLALMLNDRLYGPVSVKVKRHAANDDQFELQFAWEDASGEQHSVKAIGEHR
jgi:hypothetical protein